MRQHFHDLLDRAMGQTTHGEYFLPRFVELMLHDMTDPVGVKQVLVDKPRNSTVPETIQNLSREIIRDWDSVEFRPAIAQPDPVAVRLARLVLAREQPRPENGLN